MRRDYRPAESLSCSCKLALSAHKIIKEMGAESNSPVKKGNESRNPSSLIGKQFKFPMSSKMVLGVPWNSLFLATRQDAFGMLGRSNTAFSGSKC